MRMLFLYMTGGDRCDAKMTFLFCFVIIASLAYSIVLYKSVWRSVFHQLLHHVVRGTQ